MNKIRKLLEGRERNVAIAAVLLVFLAGLLLYKLGSLVGGLSRNEYVAAGTPLGWHSIYHQPYNLPLDLVSSLVYGLAPDHGQTLSRLPNALFGAASVICFAWLIRLWHGARTALFATLLFMTSAWVLHASRLASFDVLYLWGMTSLLLGHAQLQRHGDRPLVVYANLILWSFLLYVPGMVWLVLASLVIQWKVLFEALQDFESAVHRTFQGLLAIWWWPLLLLGLTRHGALQQWIGLPAHFAQFGTILKQFVAVPVHLFIRGPQYPDIWLGRAPILDIFTLVACVVGIYFYATHLGATRSRLLTTFLVVGGLLVGLNGPVGLSLLVPILYVCVATGIAYLLLEWMKVFPVNPFARGLGLLLVSIAVALSCTYNLRSYFVAWPHNVVTMSTFRYHR